MKHSIKCALVLSCAFSAFALGAHADPIQNPTATFAGLDKTTGRIVNFDVSIGETVQFGTLQIIPRVCNTRPQTETPQTTSFVEVEELIAKPTRETRAEDKVQQPSAEVKESKRLFTGWMFAASPGLHGVEHPVYDVWLVDCKGGKEVAAPIVATPGDNADGVVATPVEESKKKKSRKVEPAAPAPVETQAIGPADQPVAAPIQTETAPAPADAADPNAAGKKKKKSKTRQQGQDTAPAPVAPAPGGGLLPF
ncbi:MAG: DUF2155 domain-containing protein [Methylocystis sp.]